MGGIAAAATRAAEAGAAVGAIVEWAIEQGDVVEWATRYNGSKFHALLCDSPYHLGKQGFMGRKWDASGVAFRPETWAALATHLHPGAFGMAFASSRGWHRLAVAIEDAGLIIHPSIFGWAFGCLSDDTEILTDSGWRFHHELTSRSVVACYDVNRDNVEWRKVENVYRYEINDTAYRVQSDSTDQIVSRNHRCLVERGGEYVFRAAETLQSKEIVPVLATVPDLRKAVQRRKHSTIPQKAPLFSGVRNGSGGAPQEGAQARATPRCERLQSKAQAPGGTYDLSCVWRAKIQNRSAITENQKVRARLLFKELFGEGGSAPPPNSAFREWSRKKEANARTQGGSQWLLERRSDLSQTQGELCQLPNQICALPEEVSVDGAQGWIRNGTSSSGCAGNRPLLAAFRGGSSRQSRSNRQSAGKPNAVLQQFGSQKIRGAGATRPTLATITPFCYSGIVWCVQVPTGAFVARRNGKAFVTGNSGFPKATRVPDERFNGHRYGLQAMKPALEPIIVFQVPYVGKPVDCIAETGAGALWVDGARIGGDTITAHGGSKETRGVYGSFEEQERGSNERLGRWPANLALIHSPSCNGSCVAGCPVREMDLQAGDCPSGDGLTGKEPSGDAMAGATYGGGLNRVPWQSYNDSGGPSRFFLNADWMHERLESESPVFYAGKAASAERDAGLVAGNVHPTIKPLSLVRWLATLLLPPIEYAPRRLLVPFSGAGSEMIGAGLAGWEFCQGIELNKSDDGSDYIAIAEARLKHWLANPLVSVTQQDGESITIEQMRLI